MILSDAKLALPHSQPQAKASPLLVSAQRWSGRLGWLVVFMLVLTLSSKGAPPEKILSYTDVLRHLTDLDRLTHLQTGKRGGLFSSWDRNGTNHWGANGDAGHYLRVDPNGEAVMMEIDGPGVIYRIWSANPMGKMRVYLDGAETPNYEWNFPDLFDGKLAPFIKPLVYRRDKAQSASDCYLPIPFAKHIKITADKAHGQYYHFNYVLFPKEEAVASFRLPLTAEEQVALSAVAELWSNPGRDPKPKLPGQQTISRKITLAPDQTVELCDLKQTGVIRAIRARVESNQRYAWRKLVLQGHWDDAVWPQILTPLGPFFGFDWDTADYGSMVAGCRSGQAYQYFPMPFRTSAKLELRSFLEATATAEVEIEWAPLDKLPEDTVYFYARWRHEPDTVNFEYPFLETAGRGHFVGVSMPIDHPLEGWWGEGDEKVWVDDDDFPPYIGTGSEDYFGDAWGIRYLSEPSFGASSMKGHRTCNYRWHFTDIIPFTKRMRMTIENYGPNGQGPRGQYEFSSTAFWYQAEPTPPFSELRRVKFTGGNDPSAKPAGLEYNPHDFPNLNADSVRTYGLGITFAQQAEVLLAEAIRAGTARMVTDGLRPYEFDREKAVDFGPVTNFRKLGEINLQVESDGVFQPRLHTARENGCADISLALEGTTLPIISRPAPNALQLGSLFLTKGEHKASLVAVTAGRAIFDSLQLAPVARVSGALEAEGLAVMKTTGGAVAPRPSDPLDEASAGRVLEFNAEKDGQGFVLNLGRRPALPYVLGVRPMVGPKAPVIQAFAADKAIGPRFDLYAEKRAPGPAVLPLGPVPAAAMEIEIQVVGRNERAQGAVVELDYLRWEPDIMGPDTTEGVWAQVVGKSRCDYRPQDLGAAYSGGHQFWVQPCDLKGWVDIAVEIPRKGTHEIVAKYTKSWDYATIQASLDGKPLGPEVDTYAANVVPGEPVTLGKEELSAGRHILRFQAVGHNPESKGYLMGIDHVIVKSSR